MILFLFLLNSRLFLFKKKPSYNEEGWCAKLWLRAPILILPNLFYITLKFLAYINFVDVFKLIPAFYLRLSNLIFNGQPTHCIAMLYHMINAFLNRCLYRSRSGQFDFLADADKMRILNAIDPGQLTDRCFLLCSNSGQRVPWLEGVSSSSWLKGRLYNRFKSWRPSYHPTNKIC